MKIRIAKLMFFLGCLGFVISGCGSSNPVMNILQDRYKPFSFIGKRDNKVLVKFQFDALSAQEVYLAGSFNKWKVGNGLPKYPEEDFTVMDVVIPMKKNPKTSRWEVIIPLEPGKYTYKYCIDNGRVWMEDKNTELVDDEQGGKNSVIIVIN